LRGQQLHEFAEFAAQKAPAALDVLDQRVRLVLGEHPHAADARVHAVGQRKVDDAKLPAERNRRLGAPVGQVLQTRPPAAGEYQRQRIARQTADEAFGVHHAHGSRPSSFRLPCFALVRRRDRLYHNAPEAGHRGSCMQRVLFVTSEAHPLAKTGGLGDVCGSLPPALARLGHDVRLLMPAYRDAKRGAGALRPVTQIPIAFAGAPATLLEGRLPGTELTLWLVDYPAAFEREGHPYLAPDGQPWPDNAPRFALLCAAAVALALGETALDWHPDVVHCHDWQSGLVPALLALRPG